MNLVLRVLGWLALAHEVHLDRVNIRIPAKR